jgi:hypothetical protein
MSHVFDVTAAQPPLPGRLMVQDFASEELVAYHQHLALYF